MKTIFHGSFFGIVKSSGRYIHSIKTCDKRFIVQIIYCRNVNRDIIYMVHGFYTTTPILVEGRSGKLKGLAR